MGCKAVVIAGNCPTLPFVRAVEIPGCIRRGAAIETIVRRRGLQRHNSARHAHDVRERHRRGIRHEQIRRVGRQRCHSRIAWLLHRADPLVQVFVVHHFLEAVELAALAALAVAAGIVERQYHRRGLCCVERAVVGHALDIVDRLRDVHTHEVLARAVDGHVGPLIPVIEAVFHHCVTVLRRVVVAVVEEAVLVALHHSVVGGRIAEVVGRNCCRGCGAALPIAEDAGVVAVRHVVGQGRLTVWIDESEAVVAQRVFARAVCGGSG
ncbi:MAG: hypothetical protein II278_05870 [Bacteroidaceae bacterium]|nr:hypothetical protein [Bacteroidaceae bacterium]